MPPPSEASSVTRIANTSATTHIPIANGAAAQPEHDRSETGIEIAPPNSVAISIARYGFDAAASTGTIVPRTRRCR